MQNEAEKTPQSVSWWITSLAISVTCCAVLFVIFANYLSGIKSQLESDHDELVGMSQHQERLLAEIQSLHKAIAPPQPTSTVAAPTSPAESVAPVAPVAVPPAIEPPTAHAPVGTAIPAVVAPTVAAPPVTAPSLPEPPAKK